MVDDRDYDALAADIAESEGNGDLAHALHQLSHVKAKLAEVEAERDALDDPRVEALVEAGKAVVDRWDSPLWKDLPHTGESIADLRAALSSLETKQ